MLVFRSSGRLGQNWRRPFMVFSRLDGPLCSPWLICQHQSRCHLLCGMNLWSLLYNTRFHEGPSVHWGIRNKQWGALSGFLFHQRGQNRFWPYLDRDVFYYDTERLLAHTERDRVAHSAESLILHCLCSKNNLISSINKRVFRSINNESSGGKKLNVPKGRKEK